MSAEVEARFSNLLNQKDLAGATTLAFTAYGDELFAFLVHHVRDEAAAADIYSQVAEDLWTGLPNFRQQCALRTWLYLLARHAASRYARAPWRHLQTSDSAAQHLANAARSRTPDWLRSDVKDRFRAIRDQLEPDDSSLLALRIDRRMAWDDLARVFLDEQDPPRDTVKRESARLRKRFQLVKERLKQLAGEAGLLEDASD